MRIGEKIWKRIRLIPAKNIIVFGDQGLVSGGNFLVTLFLARFMGLAEFGVFALGWMLVLCCSSMQQALIIAPLYSLLPKSASQELFIKGLHSFQLIIGALILILGGIGLWGVIYFGHFDIPLTLWWVLPLLAMGFVMNDFYRRLFFATNQSVQTLGSDLFIYSTQLALIFSLNYYGRLTITNVYLGFFLVYMLVIIRNYSFFSVETNFNRLDQLLKQVWQYSKFLFGTSILQWLSGNFFIIAAGAILSPVIVGVIRVVQNVVGVLNVLFLALENIVPLNGAKALSEKGERIAMRYFYKTFWQVGAIAVGLLFFIALGREYILVTLYGPLYLEYTHVLLGFSVIYLMVFMNTFLTFIIRTFEWNKVFFFTYIVTSAFSVLTANYYITHWGILGVVGGLLTVQLLNVLVYGFWIRNKMSLI